MNRLDERFRKLKAGRQKAVIFFVTAGDPSLKITREVILFLDRAGADAVELGVPFSDPLADGPIIQASSGRALGRGVTLERILKLIRSVRRSGASIPIVLMSSYNPIFHYGTAAAVRAAARAGADAFLIPDLPVHESIEVGRLARGAGMDLILMETPTTASDRRRRIRRQSRGFVYYVSVTGVTGTRRRLHMDFKNHVHSGGPLPVCVGFGVSNAHQAARVARAADGVIIGSALVAHLDRHSRRSFTSRTRRWLKTILRAVKGRGAS